MHERLEIILLAVGGIVLGVLVIVFAAVWLASGTMARDERTHDRFGEHDRNVDRPGRSWNDHEGRDK